MFPCIFKFFNQNNPDYQKQNTQLENKNRILIRIISKISLLKNQNVNIHLSSRKLSLPQLLQTPGHCRIRGTPWPVRLWTEPKSGTRPASSHPFFPWNAEAPFTIQTVKHLWAKSSQMMIMWPTHQRTEYPGDFREYFSSASFTIPLRKSTP